MLQGSELAARARCVWRLVRCVPPKPSRSLSTSAHASMQGSKLPYKTLTKPATMTVEVTKSKFIVSAWPVDTASRAMELIQSASLPSASHNCWAYVIEQEFRSSDDGEPSGTAGKPILGAIQGEGLDHTAVLVTRFFGGVKLGAGGLVRAYGGAARECLRAAPTEIRTAKVTMQLSATYDMLGLVYGQLDKLGAARTKDEEYLDSGVVRLTVALDCGREAEFIAAMTDCSAGAITPRRCPSSSEEHS